MQPVIQYMDYCFMANICRRQQIKYLNKTTRIDKTNGKVKSVQ